MEETKEKQTNGRGTHREKERDISATVKVTKKGALLKVVPADQVEAHCYRRGPPQPRKIEPKNAWGTKTINHTPLREIMKEEKRGNGDKTIRRRDPIKNNFWFIEHLLTYLIENIPLPIPETTTFTLEPTQEDSDYSQIVTVFAKTMLDYRMTDMKRVVNPFVLCHYNLKKQISGHKELIMYHGTKAKNVQSICTCNFDWRQVMKHKFGSGVSFAPNPHYASHYSDQTDSTRVMFAVKVLVGRTSNGDMKTTVPEDGCDTTTADNQKVFVKYDDCSFYPAFVIYYENK